MFIVYLTRGENQVQFWAIMTQRAWPWPKREDGFFILFKLSDIYNPRLPGGFRSWSLVTLAYTSDQARGGGIPCGLLVYYNDYGYGYGAEECDFPITTGSALFLFVFYSGKGLVFSFLSDLESFGAHKSAYSVKC